MTKTIVIGTLFWVAWFAALNAGYAVAMEHDSERAVVFVSLGLQAVAFLSTRLLQEQA